MAHRAWWSEQRLPPGGRGPRAAPNGIGGNGSTGARQARGRRPHGDGTVHDFVALSAVPDCGAAEGLRFGRHAARALAPHPPARTLVQDTVAAAQDEYAARFGPGAAGQTVALEALLARQLREEERQRERRRAAREAAARAEAEAEAAAQHAARLAKVPTAAKGDATAVALERALERGYIGGVKFNPAAALRGPGGWHIIARLAKYDDIEALATAITADIISEHAAAVAEVSFREATERLYGDVEALVRDAYPIVAALPPDQLHRMLEEARRSDGAATGGVSGSVSGRGVEELPQGVLGRKLALARKMHALVVKEFNRDLGIRTRSAAAANLAQSRAQRLAERAAKAEGAGGDGGEGGGNGRGHGSLGGGSRGGARGSVRSGEEGGKQDRAGATMDKEDEDVEDDRRVPRSSVRASVAASAAPGVASQVHHRRSGATGGASNQPASKRGAADRAVRHLANDSDDDQSNDNDNCGSVSERLGAAAVASSAPIWLQDMPSRRRGRGHDRSNGGLGEGPGADETDGADDAARVFRSEAAPSPEPPLSPLSPPSPLSPRDGLWSAIRARCEALGMSELRAALVARGLDPRTPGLAGPPRHYALRARLEAALRAAAECADRRESLSPLKSPHPSPWAAGDAGAGASTMPSSQAGSPRGSQGSQGSFLGNSAGASRGGSFGHEGARLLRRFLDVGPIAPAPMPKLLPETTVRRILKEHPANGDG